MPFGSDALLVMTVGEPKRAVGAGSKRFYVREPARSVITRRHCHVTLNWSMSRRWSGSQEEASGQQIEPRSAIHLPLQHLQAVDLDFDRSLTPGQRHPGHDRGTVLPQSFGKAPEGREGTGGRACQKMQKLRPTLEPFGREDLGNDCSIDGCHRR